MKKLITDDPIYALHEYGIDADGLQIFLTGHPDYAYGQDPEEMGEPGVEYNMVSRFIKNMHILRRNAGEGKKGSPYKPILIHLKTDGGAWQEGMAVYDAINLGPQPTVIISYTHARSMSSIILQAADKRVLMPNSIFMFHGGTLSISGTTKQVESTVAFGKMEWDVMLEIYAVRMKKRGKYSNWPKKKIKEMMLRMMNQKEDVFLTAKEAVEWGLADEVFDGNWKKLCSI